MRKASLKVINARIQAYKQGWHHGYRIGGSSKIKTLIAPPHAQKRPVRVMAVRSGFTAIDHGISAAMRLGAADSIDIDAAQCDVNLLQQWRPDLLLVINGKTFPTETIAQAKQLGIKTAVWFVDDPYHIDVTEAVAPSYDYVFTHEQSCMPIYERLGCRTYQLPLGANRHDYQPLHPPAAYWADICFIGNGFPNRLAFIDDIAPFLMTKKVIIAGWWWDQLRHFPQLQPFIHLNQTWMPPDETAKYYNGAKIVINLHRSHVHDATNDNSKHVPALSVNPRTFEINACAAFQLTDERADLGHFYTPGQDIVTFQSPKDCIEKMAHYLAHDAARTAIALNGYRRTLQEHSFEHRVFELLRLIFD